MPMEDKFDDYVEALAEALNTSKEKVLELVEEKKRELGYLVNDDVAVRLVAKEAGIELSTKKRGFKLQICDLKPGMVNVNVGGIIKDVEGVSQVGNELKMRLKICDETGEAYVILTVKNLEEAEIYKPGKYLYITSGLVKEGPHDSVEVKIGKSGKISVKDVLEEARCLLKGVIVRSFDPIEYEKGKVASALLRCDDGKLARLLVWGFDAKLEVGDVVEIYDVDVRTKKVSANVLEVHVNDLRALKVVAHEKVQPLIKKVRLCELKGDEKDIAVEGVVEEVFRGNVYSKVILRDGEVSLPIIFWKKSPDLLDKLGRGHKVLIDGCKVKHSRNGLELHVMRWSKVRVL
ncbi:MAG: hypothetical protein DRJ31_06120 [Candidatus Methanomethylicota archaeon]|nr:MAG: hypothetical protein DRJ31_06120 [Candidatus Verstraetearchaeota archaeon]